MWRGVNGNKYTRKCTHMDIYMHITAHQWAGMSTHSNFICVKKKRERAEFGLEVKCLIHPINVFCQQKFHFKVTFRRRICADGM